MKQMVRMVGLSLGLLLSRCHGQEDPLGGLMAMLGGLAEGLGDSAAPPAPPLCGPGQEAVPKMDQHEKLSANGCGPQGMQIQEPFGLYRCCNGHDVCFSVCGTTHAFCEQEFQNCMKEVCKNPLQGKKKDCKQQAKTFSVLTKSFGADFHSDSQRETCQCVPKGEAVAKRHREYLTAFMKRYNSSAATEEEVDDALSQYQGREGELYLRLVKIHGNNFVRFDNIKGEFLNLEL